MQQEPTTGILGLFPSPSHFLFQPFPLETENHIRQGTGMRESQQAGSFFFLFKTRSGVKQQPHMAAIKGNGRENIPVQDCVWRKLKWCRIPIQVPFLFLSSPSNWAARHRRLGELSWCPERSIPFPEYPVLPTHTKGLLPRFCFPPSHPWAGAENAQQSSNHWVFS